MHGAGNDFIMIDNSSGKIRLSEKEIEDICHRQRGVGGDGLILVEKSEQAEFDAVMKYYNSDGSRGEMCGNGLRCTAYFCRNVLKLTKHLNIKTDAGILEAVVLDDLNVSIAIPVLERAEMIEIGGRTAYYANTGVPHVVVCVDSLAEYDVCGVGREIRSNPMFKNGANVNFVEAVHYGKSAAIRTYERGVEDETLACGTGISASALCLHVFCGFDNKINFITKDRDELQVELKDSNSEKLYLKGPAKIVFKGEINIR